MAAIVHKDSSKYADGKYYLDEIVDAEGFRFNVQKQTPALPKADHPTNSGDNGSTQMSVDESIQQSAGKSNRENAQKSEGNNSSLPNYTSAAEMMPEGFDEYGGNSFDAVGKEK